MSVVQGANVLVKERLLRVPDSCILVDLLHKVTDDAVELDAEASVMCCKQLNSAWIDASVTDDVGLLVNDFGCRYIRFQIPPKVVEPPPPKRARAATEALMGTSRSILYVRVGLECNLPIETAYYSSNLSLPCICYYCGSFNAERDPELLRIFRSMTPLCRECKTTSDKASSSKEMSC